MSEIILYPTETIYALGVDPFNELAWLDLCALKGRDTEQTASWLVRNIEDIERYAELPEIARKIAEDYLPGPLTLILKAKDIVPDWARGPLDTVSFRVSSDPAAEALINEHMALHDAPLTCTSANVHGLDTAPTPKEIKEQFGPRAEAITRTIDDDVRYGMPSTVVRVLGDQVEVLREGTIVLDTML